MTTALICKHCNKPIPPDQPGRCCSQKCYSAALPLIFIHQVTQAGGEIASACTTNGTHAAYHARMEVAREAVQISHYYSLTYEQETEKAQWLTDQPALPGSKEWYTVGNCARPIEKVNAYCYTVHKLSESIPATVTIFAKIHKTQEKTQ